MRDRIKGTPAGANDSSTTALGDWFATALFWRPQVAMLVNERTLLPVFVPLAPASTLLARIPEAIAAVLRRHGAADAFIEAELEAMRDVRIAPTNSRSVIGVMNGFAFTGEFHWQEGLTDCEELSLRMSSHLLGPLMKRGSGSPDSELAAVLHPDARSPIARPPSLGHRRATALLTPVPTPVPDLRR